MGKLYSDKEISALKRKREIYALAKLLINIKEEEPNVVPIVKRKTPNLNFNQSFLALSNVQIYKSYSIAGIMKHFKLDTKYLVIDLAMLLDIWFNNSSFMEKSSLLKCDILILHGKAIEYQAETKATALIELISSRKTLGKLTWLYMEEVTLDKFNDLYKGVSGTLSNQYQINISKPSTSISETDDKT